jgi:tetratricopeptide (TPR) repeat protein
MAYRHLSGLGQAASPRDQARALYDSGHTKYRARDYAGALADWQAAYRLVSLPTVLIGIAQAFEKLNRKEEARAHYQRYLWAEPNGEHAERARAGVARNTPGAELSVSKGEQPSGEPGPSISDKYLIPEDAIEAEAVYAERTSKKIWIATGVGIAALIGVGVALMRVRKPVTANKRRRRR